MPVLPKVKIRIGVLICLVFLVIQPIPRAICAPNDKPRSKSIGERAISKPNPPVISPSVLKNVASAKVIGIKIDLSKQRLQLIVDGKTAIDTPVSTGRKRLETPTGKFFVKAREATRKASDYGNHIDSTGKVIVAGVYRDRDPTPSRLRFSPAPRNHILTVEGQKFILHAGAVGGLPVSDGAVIIPHEIAKLLSSKVGAGCPIEIIEGQEN